MEKRSLAPTLSNDQTVWRGLVLESRQRAPTAGVDACTRFRSPGAEAIVGELACRCGRDGIRRVQDAVASCPATEAAGRAGQRGERLGPPNRCGGYPRERSTGIEPATART